MIFEFTQNPDKSVLELTFNNFKNQFGKDNVTFQEEKDTFIISNIAGKEMSFIIDKNQKKIKESYGKSREEYLRDTANYLSMYSKF